MSGPNWYWKDGTLACGSSTHETNWLEKMRAVEAKLTDPAYKIVARDELPGDVLLSTVWLGLDQRWTDDGPPQIFETMVFGGDLDGTTNRYATEDEAKAGHAELLARLRGVPR